MGLSELYAGTEALRLFPAPQLHIALRFVRRHLVAERVLYVRALRFLFDLKHPVAYSHLKSMLYRSTNSDIETV